MHVRRSHLAQFMLMILQEGFDIGPPKSSFGKDTGKDENVWPEALASTSFKADVLAVYEGITALTKRLFPLFALALGLDEHFFDDKTQDQSSIMRCMFCAETSFGN